MKIKERGLLLFALLTTLLTAAFGAADSTIISGPFAPVSDSLNMGPALQPVSDSSSILIPDTKFFIGAGGGLSIGSIPLFSLWGQTLPDSLRFLGLSKDFGKVQPDSANSISADTMDLRYKVTESPEIYNIAVPVHLTFMHVNDNRALSLGLALFYTSKQFQSNLYIDQDTARHINLSEKMSFYSVALEIGYQKPIPVQYFKIDGADMAYFSTFLSISPLCVFSKSESIKTFSNEDDQRITTIQETLKPQISDLSARGAALSWQLGISTLKRYPSGSALNMGLYYIGSFHALFSEKGKTVYNKEISPSASKPDKPVSFLSTRLEFKVDFLKGLQSKGSLKK